jgi:AhpD family alkylhydroperoxidase
MAHSPAVLDAYLQFSAAMSRAGLGEKLHTQVKLATSQSNDCDYCTSILCALGPSAGLTAADLLESRAAASADARTDAALRFAKSVLGSRGDVADDELRAVRAAGFGEPEIVEIVASVVLGCFTNFLNNVARTELDFAPAGPLPVPAA